MRSVFTSPRLENVEAVAKLLADAGIEVRISQDRSYKGSRRRPFSYRDNGNAEPNPQVWVIKAEDQPKARMMLREAGLIESTRIERNPSHSYLPLTPAEDLAPKRDRRAVLATRMRLALLVIIVLLTILTLSGALHRGA